jgi:hypothetical protein
MLGAVAGVLLSTFWALLAMASSMGWGGRSDLQIAMIVVLLLLFPIYLSLGLAARAFEAARKGRNSPATLFALGSLLCAPTSWSLLALGLFAP